MNTPHYPHRRVPRDAAGRSQARPRGDSHPRASGRGPDSSPPEPPAASVAPRSSALGVASRSSRTGAAKRPLYRIYSEEEFFAADPTIAFAPSSCGERRRRARLPWTRLGALAALVGVVTAAVAVVVWGATRSRSPQSSSRPLADATATRPPVGSPAQVVGRRLGPHWRHAVRRGRSFGGAGRAVVQVHFLRQPRMLRPRAAVTPTSATPSAATPATTQAPTTTAPTTTAPTTTTTSATATPTSPPPTTEAPTTTAPATATSTSPPPTTEAPTTTASAGATPTSPTPTAANAPHAAPAAAESEFGFEGKR